MEIVAFLLAVALLVAIVRQGMQHQPHSATLVVRFEDRSRPPIGASDPEVQAMLQDMGIDTETIL